MCLRYFTLNVSGRVRSCIVTVLLGLLAFAGLRCTPSAAPGREAVGFPVFGYYASWMGDQWTAFDLSLIDTLFFFDLVVDSSGAIVETNGWPYDWQALVTHARAADTRIVPSVTVVDEASFEALFLDPEAVRRLEDTLFDLALDPNADGLHVDFEVFRPMPSGMRDTFSAFYASLAARIAAARPDHDVSIFLPAFDHPEVFDEVALAAVSDYVIVQGYDIHWRDAPRAGPVAPLRGWQGANWEGILARYDALGIPRDRLYFSVPYYGYEWPTVSDRPGAPTRGPARIVTYAPFDSLMPPDFSVGATSRIRDNGRARDSLSGSPFYVYQDADGWYQGWFEDAHSLQLKYNFVRHNQLGGVALFALGYDRDLLRDALVDR